MIQSILNVDELPVSSYMLIYYNSYWDVKATQHKAQLCYIKRFMEYLEKSIHFPSCRLWKIIGYFPLDDELRYYMIEYLKTCKESKQLYYGTLIMDGIKKGLVTYGR